MEKMKLTKRNGYKCVNFHDFMYINTSVNWWVAEITGLHPKFKFNRSFLDGFTRNSKRQKEPYLPVENIPLNVLIEIVGGSRKNQNRQYVIFRKVERDYIFYERFSEGEIVSMFRDMKPEERYKEILEKMVKEIGKARIISILAEIKED